MLKEVLHKIAVMMTIGLGSILTMNPVTYYFSFIINNKMGQLIVGIGLIAIGLYISNNYFNDK